MIPRIVIAVVLHLVFAGIIAYAVDLHCKLQYWKGIALGYLDDDRDDGGNDDELPPNHSRFFIE